MFPSSEPGKPLEPRPDEPPGPRRGLTANRLRTRHTQPIRTMDPEEMTVAVQQRAIRTRAAVLDAAAEVFAKTGYSATTLNDITAAAGVTKGAVYFHFPDKEAVANALIEDFFGQQASLLED